MLAAILPPKVEDLSFIVGAWRHEAGTEVLEETWNPYSAGTILGSTKHIRSGETRLLELLSIEPSEKGITMWVVLGRPARSMRKPEPFHLLSLEGKKAVFEHPDNDFPKRITYERRGPRELNCLLEGTEGGKPAREEYRFRLR